MAAVDQLAIDLALAEPEQRFDPARVRPRWLTGELATPVDVEDVWLAEPASASSGVDTERYIQARASPPASFAISGLTSR